MQHTKILISEIEIREKVKEIGIKITNDYFQNKEILLIGLLRGSVIFLADLMREIKIEDVRIDFMLISSYGKNMTSSRNIKVLKDLEEDIKGKDIIIIEDIIDTGNTLTHVINLLKIRQPKSIKIAALLDKPTKREVDVKVDYCGFEIPDEFVVGYGIDYAEKYRNLRNIEMVLQ